MHDQQQQLTSAHLLIMASPWRCTSLAQASSRIGKRQISSAPFWDCSRRQGGAGTAQHGIEHEAGWGGAQIGYATFWH